MTKDVNLNSDTWTKMTGALTAIMESATETYSSASVSSAYQGSYSSGKAGFAKRIDDLVKISEKAKTLIAEKDTDGVVSFSYHDDRESATTLQVSLGKLERYSSNVSRYVKEKIDQPFYEAMDKVGARLEALSIRSYTTTNTVGFKKTEVVVDATGSRLETREVRPQTIGLSDLYQVESPYKTALARSYEQFKTSETYKEHKLSQDDYLMAMHHTRAFVYESIDDHKENIEFWRDLTLSAGVVILTIFCPPAGAAAGFVLAGAEMYSASTGKDWGTGRELDTTERGLRAGFALFDLIPGIGYINDLAKSGSKVAAKEFIQTSIQKGMAQGAKNLDSFKQVLKQVKGFGDTILTNMDTYAKQLDTLIKSKVSTLADNLAGKLHHADEAISEAARNFCLNVGLEPQLVSGVMSASGSGKLSSLADNLQAFAKNLDGSVDEVVESTKESGLFSVEWEKTRKSFPDPKLEQQIIDDILDIKVNIDQGELRPDPRLYLSSEYIDEHAKLFDGGVAAFARDDYWIKETGYFGRPDGAFVFPKDVAESMVKEANGDPRTLEKLLGLDEGSLGDNPIMIQSQDVDNLRIPNGNEGGSAQNPQWRPGGLTYPGGIPEAVIDRIPKEKIEIIEIWRNI